MKDTKDYSYSTKCVKQIVSIDKTGFMRFRSEIKKCFVILLVLLQVFIWSMLYADNDREASPIASADAVTDKTNIHYTGKYCDECHLKTPAKSGELYLKFKGDFSQLCRCHNSDPGSYLHPVEIELSSDKRSKIPEALPLQKNKITCATCHDIVEEHVVGY